MRMRTPLRGVLGKGYIAILGVAIIIKEVGVVKKFLFIITMITIVSFANPAFSSESGVYVVKKGDSIYKIATEIFHLNWRQVASEAKKRNRIFPEEKISLSDLIDTKAVNKVRLGRSPFREFGILSETQLKKDKRGLVEIYGLSPSEADKILKIHKKAFAEKSQEGYRENLVGNGDRFDIMLFGDMKVIYNPIIVETNKKQLAYVYPTSNRKEIWYILYCGNWTVKSSKIMAKLKKKIVPPPPAPPFVALGELERMIAEYQQPKKYKWDWDSTWGAFDERYQDGNKVKGWWQSTTLYPVMFDDDTGDEWSFGINYTTRDWKGETGEEYPFRYKGDVNLLSLAGRFRDSARDWEIIGRLGLGERKDEGYLVNEWGRHDMTQKTDIFNIYSSAEYNKRADKKWFSKTRGSIELEFGFNEQKESYWTDEWSGRQALGGEPDNKDAFSLALYSDAYNLDQKKSVQMWAEGRSTYYAENYRWGNRIMGGLSFWNGSIKAGPGYTWWNRDHSDSDGWYAEVSLYNLYYSVVGYPADDDWDFERKIEEGY